MSENKSDQSGRFRELIELLLRYLRTHARGSRADHDDLVQQTLADFYRVRRDQLSTFRADAQLALAILRRRIADHYRDISREAIADYASEDDETDAARHFSVHSDAQLLLAHRRLLHRVLAIVMALPPRDRELVLSRADGAERAMTPAERKRLSRIRTRIRAELENTPSPVEDEPEELP